LFPTPPFSGSRPSPAPPRFPYTTLFRSRRVRDRGDRERRRCRERARRDLQSKPAVGRADAAPRGTDLRRGRNCGGNRRDRRDDEDRKSTRLNSSHVAISYAVFCLKKKKK